MNQNKIIILTAHQPVYLPWLGLFHKIDLADKFVVLDTVQYLKQDWNNRNKIKSSQGVQWLTVPVLSHKKSTQSLIEVLIDNSSQWRVKHLKSIETCYSKAPYFDKYIDFFRGIYKQKWGKLIDLNDVILRFILKELNIETEILYSHNMELSGHKSDLVLDLCKKIGANGYIFGALGKNYAQVEKFNANGIKIMFQDYKHPEYPQRFDGFEPFLAVIDLLFNCGPESRSIIMSGNVSKADI